MDGFYWGEANGRRGYVPCNMVSEMHPDDERPGHEMVRLQNEVEIGAEFKRIDDLRIPLNLV